MKISWWKSLDPSKTWRTSDEWSSSRLITLRLCCIIYICSCTLFLFLVLYQMFVVNYNIISFNLPIFSYHYYYYICVCAACVCMYVCLFHKHILYNLILTINRYSFKKKNITQSQLIQYWHPFFVYINCIYYKLLIQYW